AVPLPAGTTPTPRPAAEPSPAGGWTVEPLQGWHLPLLDDPAFLPLQPLLQRALLLALPERLVSALVQRPPLVPQVLVALGAAAGGGSRALGLIVSRRLNRSGTCWQVEHLRIALAVADDPHAPQRRELAGGLLREAIGRVRGAASWIATASSLDHARLATLREQGFQPQRTDRVWRWGPGDRECPAPADTLQLRPLNRRTAPLLWHLEQAATPAHLRQLLDRRIEDLLDHSDGRGWMLVDPTRNEAVAGARRCTGHPAGGDRVEFSVHPGWGRLLGPPTELLLHRLADGGGVLWLTSEVGNDDRRRWLESLGAESHGEEVLMARSVWRRQEWQPAEQAARRIGAVLERFQPRRRPLPTPAGQR
ncbi:MAG: hypothetical protein VKI81_02170, partial [Synechococcaceae cyanobacterium]|nr:hypothetical protein [Synechococcaceae cyanobacterium]